jgi:hypothetical protein
LGSIIERDQLALSNSKALPICKDFPSLFLCKRVSTVWNPYSRWSVRLWAPIHLWGALLIYFWSGACGYLSHGFPIELGNSESMSGQENC